MGATILLCEDNESMRDLVNAALAETDYTVVEAHEGDEAIKLARELRPDLILLDVVMPLRSGIEVLKELRSDLALASTPVIILTASRALDADSAIALGAQVYMTKPFSPAGLLTTIERLLAGQASENRASAPRPI